MEAALLASTLWSHLQVWRLAELAGGGPEVRGRVWIRGGGQLRIGAGVRLDASAAPIELHAEPDGELVIENGAYIGGGTSIEAQRSVRIGPGAHIDPFCKVLDNHFHPLRGDRQVRPDSAPVVIGARARIGRRAIVLPGARVQAGATIQPGAVVRGPARPRAAPPDAVAPPLSDFSPLLRVLAVPRGDPIDAMRRVASILRARWLFRSCERGARPYAAGRVRVRNEGRIVIGDRAAFVGGMIPTELVSHTGATLDIGERTVFNYGASIEAFRSIRIGRRCMLASMVRICDREPEETRPITIGHDVWIAHGATICPGVTIGNGSVVSAGSVVTRDLPPGSLAVGNPARSLSLELVAPR